MNFCTSWDKQHSNWRIEQPSMASPKNTIAIATTCSGLRIQHLFVCWLLENPAFAWPGKPYWRPFGKPWESRFGDVSKVGTPQKKSRPKCNAKFMWSSSTWVRYIQERKIENCAGLSWNDIYLHWQKIPKWLIFLEYGWNHHLLWLLS